MFAFLRAPISAKSTTPRSYKGVSNATPLRSYASASSVRPGVGSIPNLSPEAEQRLARENEVRGFDPYEGLLEREGPERKPEAIIYTTSHLEAAEKFDLPARYIADPETHMIMIRVGDLFRKLGIEDDDAAQSIILRKYDISAGATTLEFALPSPPPFHTYEEVPLMNPIPGSDETYDD